jgi:hypothetical protein
VRIEQPEPSAPAFYAPIYASIYVSKQEVAAGISFADNIVFSGDNKILTHILKWKVPTSCFAIDVTHSAVRYCHL